MRRTKIVCTIGPASRSPESLEQLIRAGMDVARLNFSHGTQAEHLEVITAVRRIDSSRTAARVVPRLVPFCIFMQRVEPTYDACSLVRWSKTCESGLPRPSLTEKGRKENQRQSQPRRDASRETSTWFAERTEASDDHIETRVRRGLAHRRHTVPG
ncbi:MAG TPA: pyruvate kinase, partial [Vicinamibacterales bacterium]